MKKDYLKREELLQDLMLVVNSLSEAEKGATFAIDGTWGSGKSFLLDMFINRIEEIQSEDNLDDRYFIVQYDCWKYDFYSEPTMAILSSLREQIENKTRVIPGVKENENIRKAVNMMKEYLVEYGSKIIESQWGFSPKELLEKGEEDVEKENEEKEKEDIYRTLKKVLNSIRNELEKIAKEKTIIFVVDELDRCLPEYAIIVLERLHHIFSGISNFITVLAIDKNSLHNVVSYAYGKEIDTDAYLKKIIDFYFYIGNGELDDNFLDKYEDYKKKFVAEKPEDIFLAEEYIKNKIKEKNMREQEKIFLKSELIHDILGEEPTDISCMLFEVLTLCFESGEYMKEYILKNTHEKIYNGYRQSNGKKYNILAKGLLSKVVWYIENILAEEKMGYCGQYYYEDYVSIKSDVEKMKKYFRLAKVMK